MTGVWLFLHILGVVLWLGLAVTLSVVTARAGRSDDPSVARFAYRTNGTLMSTLGLAGMILTVGAGFALTAAMDYGFFRPFPEHWLFQMQLLGSVAFLVGVLYEIPLSRKLARVADRAEEAAGAGENNGAGEKLERLRKRRAIVGSINGTLLLAVLLLATLKP